MEQIPGETPLAICPLCGNSEVSSKLTNGLCRRCNELPALVPHEPSIEEESNQPLLLQHHEHDFDIRIGEYDLVRWCRHCGITLVAYRPSPYKEFSTWREVKDEETAEHLINQS